MREGRAHSKVDKCRQGGRGYDQWGRPHLNLIHSLSVQPMPKTPTPVRWQTVSKKEYSFFHYQQMHSSLQESDNNLRKVMNITFS